MNGDLLAISGDDVLIKNRPSFRSSPVESRALRRCRFGADTGRARWEALGKHRFPEGGEKLQRQKRTAAHSERLLHFGPFSRFHPALRLLSSFPPAAVPPPVIALVCVGHMSVQRQKQSFLFNQGRA